MSENKSSLSVPEVITLDSAFHIHIVVLGGNISTPHEAKRGKRPIIMSDDWNTSSRAKMSHRPLIQEVEFCYKVSLDIWSSRYLLRSLNKARCGTKTYARMLRQKYQGLVAHIWARVCLPSPRRNLLFGIALPGFSHFPKWVSLTNVLILVRAGIYTTFPRGMM